MLSGNDGADAKPYQEKMVANFAHDTGDAMKPHYSILIQWSDADQCYIASLPETDYRGMLSGM